MATSPSLLSKRAQRLGSFPILLRDLFIAVGKNEFHETKNPQGIINLATAHNGAISDVIVDKLNQPDLQLWDAAMLPYPGDRMGLLRVRRAIADFLSEQLDVPKPLDPEKMCIMNGVTSVLSMMAFVLCDEGDTVLTPAPIYGAIPRDFLFQSGVQTFPVYLSSEAGHKGKEPFELTVELLESALQEATEKGHRVKALFLVNPFNPMGTVYRRDQVLAYLEFCKKHDIHCFIDEIYVCSIYDPSVQSSSLFGFHPDQLPDKLKTHAIWGFSKDFGMPGTPIGAAYSWNPDVLNALGHLADFQQVPHFIQTAVAKLLEDKEWVRSTHLPTNHKCLRESSQIVMKTLDELGISYVKPCAGLFLWADFRKYLKGSSMEDEKQLSLHLVKHGVAIPTGAAFYFNQYGWCRIVFSVPRRQLIEAMRRLKDGCLSFSKQTAETTC